MQSVRISASSKLWMRGTMPIEFEPTASFCYKFARYTLLDEIAKEPEPQSGQPFRLTPVAARVIARYLTPAQLAMEYPGRDAVGKMTSIEAGLGFFVRLQARRASESPFVWLGGNGLFRLKTDADLQDELQEVQLEAEDDDDEETSEWDGWIYAFSFPVLRKDNAPFPIKIGKTINDVDGRVAHQCRGSATFENPVILGRWQVKRVGAVESAIHATLKSRGKWRENVPGTEWFDTTIPEVERILKFVTETS